jgi:hypothetical protein
VRRLSRGEFDRARALCFVVEDAILNELNANHISVALTTSVQAFVRAVHVLGENS